MKNPDNYINQPTPAYLYNLSLLEQTLQTARKEADAYGFHLHYALKANNDEQVLKTISGLGFGADCVSGNEIAEALKQGFPAEKIAFAGVGKNDEEIKLALKSEIFSFNCESLPEIEIINQLAGEMNLVAPVALRINPNVAANTHKYITTGLDENKFGISKPEMEVIVDKLPDFKNIKLTGLHFHIGSQITDLDVFKNLCNRINLIQEFFYSRQIIVDHINVGGGLGINYHQPDEDPMPDFAAYFKIFHDFLMLRPKQHLHFELGRSLVAQMGSLLSKVIYVKETSSKKFLIIDAAMTDLIRPALYQAYHKIENLSSKEETEKYDVVGPVCESADVFSKAVSLPKSKRGDLILIRSAGAYGQVMASTYNMRKLAPVIYYRED